MPSTATDRLNGLTTSVAVKAPCRVAALTNITLAGEQTVNSVAVVEGDRVLATAQTNLVDNGIYKVSTGDWTRALDFDGNRDVVQGTIVPVVDGAGTEDLFTVTSANPITIDTTALTFSLRYGANIRYDRIAAEISAGVTPTDYTYPPGNIRRYGASVNGTSDDTAAWQAATDQCALGGGAVVHEYGTSMAALVNYRPGVTYQLGAGAVIKCLPGVANFAGRIFTTDQGVDAYDSAEDSAPVIWRGGIIDGNLDNQGTPSGLEHNAGIFLGAAGGGGRLRAVIDGVRFRYCTGDGLQIHSNVDVNVSNISAQECWRSGVSITGAYTKVRGSNWRLYGSTTNRSDFDIEVDGYDVSPGNIEMIDIELSNIDIEHGAFEISPASATATSSKSRIILNNVNHRGVATTVHGRGSVVRISNSILTWGPIDGSSNRLIWANNFVFDNVLFVFSGGTGSATFGVDLFYNAGGTTDEDQHIRFINCRWTVDSTIQAGDTVYGIYTRAQPAASNNLVEIIGGHFGGGVETALHTLGGGLFRVKGCPTFDCPTAISLQYSSTNYWDVEVHGPVAFGANAATYLAVAQGASDNVIKHYGVEMDESHNVLSDGGGSPGSNTYRGRRVIYVASAPDAATHGNVGDIARIKVPAAAGIVDYVCVTRGIGSGASWKALTTAAA